MDITLLTCTYGRPYNLAEAVECFRRQQIPEGVEAEMLILNDCKAQTLTCSVPGVRVVNSHLGRGDLCEAINAGFEEARGTWVAPLDDDDLALPFRLQNSWNWVTPRPSIKAMRQQRAWVLEHKHIINREYNLFIGSAFINREYYFDCGGAVAGNECWDVDIWNKMMATGKAFERTPTPRKTHLIYRWAGMGFHFSGLMDGTRSQKRLMEIYRQGVRNDPRFVAGDIEIAPKWHQDYEALVAEAITNRIGG